MKIILSPRAVKALKKLPKIDQIAVAAKIRLLKEDTVLLNEEKLSGFKDIFRVRIGNYRIVYRKSKSFIYVILIGHRKDIYELLKRLVE